MVDLMTLRAIYDDQLRTDAEVRSAVHVDRIGALLLAEMTGTRGFITYRDLGPEPTAQSVRELVAHASAWIAAHPDLTEVE
ncbi:hypothetical protein [Microbacterium gorillae]|uniref:hypothetical protein n=1 Tax=Microbacterium gorillae TaxID=1231063 RepID=UPI002DDD3CA2|nr:hypothetical protein [Microbacterium gorillae]